MKIINDKKEKDKIPLLIITGPTAVGKSSIAMMAAKELNGEIISADSAQIYRYLDIGTAKPTRGEQEEVKHYLIDIVNPDEEFSAAEYQKRARKEIEKITEKGKLPILCGGTGLYIKSITDNYVFSDEGGDENLRRELKETVAEKGTIFLHKKLASIDKVSAEKIHPNDSRRIIRALEVYHKKGESISGQLKETALQKSPYIFLLIGLSMEREKLYYKINARAEKMLTGGLIDETITLLKKYDVSAPAFRILGYRQCIKYINEELSYDELLHNIQKETRNYAKRQYTWFRNDKRINWIEADLKGYNPNKSDYFRFFEKVLPLIKENMP